MCDGPVKVAVEERTHGIYFAIDEEHADSWRSTLLILATAVPLKHFHLAFQGLLNSCRQTIVVVTARVMKVELVEFGERQQVGSESLCEPHRSAFPIPVYAE